MTAVLAHRKVVSYDRILRGFCARGVKTRFALNTPFVSGEWSAATDGHVMAAVRTERFVKDVYHVEGTPPNVNAIFSDRSHWYDKPRKIALSRLDLAPADIRIPKLLGKPPQAPVEQSVKCTSCRGTGKCGCKCHGQHNCGTCFGRGKVKSKKTIAANEIYLLERAKWHDRQQALKHDYVWVLGCPLQYAYLEKIVKAATAIGETHLNILAAGDPNKVLIAEAGDFRFAVMPLRTSKDTCTVLVD